MKPSRARRNYSIMQEKKVWTQNADGEITVDPKAPLSAPTSSRASQRLLAIYEIGQQLLEQREPQQVIDTIQSAILEHLEPDHACMLSIAGEGGYQVMSSHLLNLDGPAERWAVSHTVLDRVRETGLALLAMNTGSDRELKHQESVKKYKIQSVLSVPLGSSPVKGLIYATRGRRSGFFGPEDLEFLTAISVYAALAIDRAAEHHRASTDLKLKSERLSLLQGELLRYRIIGSSPRLVAAYDSVRRFAQAGAKVLLRGETGTGKELFARAYAAASDRHDRAYVPVPIPAMAPTVIESELFGHVKGAFTAAVQDKKGRFELADGGVLFLDEVGDIESGLQVKMLRFLDSGELYRIGDNHARQIDAYVVSATNRPLEEMARSGGFRADLLARLGQVVTIPPLRERPEDIPLLIEHFLEMLDRGAPRKSFTPESIVLMKGAPWELNVRQLHQAVERAVCLVDGQQITPSDLHRILGSGFSLGGEADSGSLSASEREAPAGSSSTPDSEITVENFPSLKEVVDEVERRHILKALELCEGNRKKAMALLELSAEKLYRRLKDYGLHKPGKSG